MSETAHFLCRHFAATSTKRGYDFTPDVMSLGIHKLLFPKVQAKNQTRIVFALLGTQKSPQPLGMRASSTFKALSGNSRKLIWWSWGDLNPRPKLLRRWHYMLSPVITFTG